MCKQSVLSTLNPRTSGSGIYLNGNLVPVQALLHLLRHPCVKPVRKQLSQVKSIRRSEKNTLQWERRMILQIYTVLLRVPEAINDAGSYDSVLNSLVDFRF